MFATVVRWCTATGIACYSPVLRPLIISHMMRQWCRHTVCVEALTNAAAANKAVSNHGARQPLEQGQGLNEEITCLFGAICSFSAGSAGQRCVIILLSWLQPARERL